jgi:hypothetical protein
MTKVPAFHSSKTGTQVYHNNDKCYDGNNIESYYWTSGTGNLRLCQTCADLNAQGK